VDHTGRRPRARRHRLNRFQHSANSQGALIAVSSRIATLAFDYEGTRFVDQADRRPGRGDLASAPRNRRNPHCGDRGCRCDRRLRSVHDDEKGSSCRDEFGGGCEDGEPGARARRDDACKFGLRPGQLRLLVFIVIVIVLVLVLVLIGLVVIGGAGRRVRRLMTSPARTSLRALGTTAVLLTAEPEAMPAARA
jgi:hypothetical protein